MLKSNTRRNLFGIRLNHEQLKQDLSTMWKDQIERQTQNWNFDFENLKPVEVENSARFEWSKINTKCSQFYDETELKVDSSHILSSFSKQETSESSDYETEEEEYDDALAIPTFYKYQRRQKMNESQNRLKFLHLATQQHPAHQKNAFDQLNNSSSLKNQKSHVVHRPSPRKSVHHPHQHHHQQQQQTNLIITFSENRKDTLRSAAAHPNTKLSGKNLSEVFDQTICTMGATQLTKIDQSAFKQPLKQPLKQQSLLDMLKQRKRKAGASALGKLAADGAKVAVGAQHNLRPRTTSTN